MVTAARRPLPWGVCVLTLEEYSIAPVFWWELPLPPFEFDPEFDEPCSNLPNNPVNGIDGSIKVLKAAAVASSFLYNGDEAFKICFCKAAISELGK